jgi:hypothetical protein
MAPELLENGALGLCLLIIYALIDKLIVPLASKNRKSSGANNGTESKWTGQEYKNGIYERRLSHVEKNLSDLRGTVEEARAAIQVAQVILKRIEDSLD